jgi:hypothetical protein
MRNFVDTFTGRKWRMWARNLDKAGGIVGKFAGERAEYKFPVRLGEEAWLTSNGTEITSQWGMIREQLTQLTEAGYNDRDIKDLREESIRIRQEARGYVSYVRSHNVGRGHYQPYYNLFAYVTEIQVEIWDALLQFCDSQDRADLDRVALLLGECEHLGEEALLWLPRLARKRREAAKKQANRITLVTLAILLVAIGVAIGAWYYLG